MLSHESQIVALALDRGMSAKSPGASGGELCSWSDLSMKRDGTLEETLGAGACIQHPVARRTDQAVEEYAVCSFRPVEDPDVTATSFCTSPMVAITGRERRSFKNFFLIHVQHGPNTHGVSRRYTEFEYLDRRVRPADRPQSLPRFPEKGFFKNVIPCLLNDRECALGSFLEAAVHADPQMSNPALREFLDIPENWLSARMERSPLLEAVSRALPDDELDAYKEEKDRTPRTPLPQSITPLGLLPLQDIVTGFDVPVREVYTEPELGDIVKLGPGTPHEYRGCSGVVTTVFEEHCSVIVLDDSLKFGVGECWPNFQDFAVTCASWRIGNRVVISGLRSIRHAKLNGLTGAISIHPSRGHPLFVQKPSVPDKPRFAVYVRFDDPIAAGQQAAILEPQFLVVHDRKISDLADALEELAANNQMGA